VLTFSPWSGICLVLLVAVTWAEPSMDPFSRLRQKIPRIGRRGQIGIVSSDYDDSESFPMYGSLSSYFLKSSKSVPRIGRRQDLLESHEKNPWPAKLSLEEVDGSTMEASQNAREVYKMLIDHWLQQQRQQSKEDAAMD
jgi:hypothetical protein